MNIPLYICEHHFAPDLAPDVARELFAHSVILVEIETHTFCNRTCHYCPNVDIPARQKRGTEMSHALYSGIIDALASIGYSGVVTYSRYNEPLAERELILARIREARSALPRATLISHTNGDYLTREYLNTLRDAGLNKLFIQTYLGNGERYDEGKILARQAAQLRRLGLTRTSSILEVPNHRFHYYTNYPGMQVTVDARNFDAPGMSIDRVQITHNTQPTYVRNGPCWIPFRQVYIDWDGSMQPCCNLRSDVHDTAYYKLTDGSDLFTGWARAAGWRRGLVNYGPKDAPCTHCSYEEPGYDGNLVAQLKPITEWLSKESKNDERH